MLGWMMAVGMALAADPLVGIWSGDRGDTVELRADGSATYGGQALQWEAETGMLAFQGTDGTAVFAYQLQGDTLSLSDWSTTVVMHRVASSAAPSVAPTVEVPAPVRNGETRTAGGGLVGRWFDGKETVVLGADGLVAYAGGTYRWRQDGANVVIGGTDTRGAPAGTAGEAAVPFTLAGDRLTFTRDGQTSTFVRLAGAAGAWVGNETSVDAQFAMSYTQYLTLFPDGSVGWSKSELTGSRSEPAPGWERFTSSSASGGVAGSAGTWTEQGGQLVVRYNDGRSISGVVDGSGSRVNLRGAGVLEEGATVTFERR